MKPKFFPEKNHTFTAPKDMPKCLPLYVHQTVFEGFPTNTSRWQPTDEERKAIAEGADIWLTCFTEGHVPVSLNVGKDFYDLFTVEPYSHDEMLADIASAANMPLEVLQGIYYCVVEAQIMYPVDASQLANHGIPIFEALAQVLEIPISEVAQQIRDGNVSFVHLKDAFKSFTAPGGPIRGCSKKKSE